MKTKTERILTVMHVIAWIIFIGLCIQTGAVITSYVVSLNNPMGAKNLYMGLDFFDLRQYSLHNYALIVFCVIVVSALKAYIVYLTIKIFLKINMSQPFSIEVANLIQKISQVAFIAGLAALAASGYSQWVTENGFKVTFNWSSSELLLLAGIIFIIAQVFKKGLELQSENELTI